MAKYRADLSEPAESALMDIVRYIFSQPFPPLSAFRTMEVLEEAIESLSDLLQRCPLIAGEYLSPMGDRKLIVKNYVV